MLDSDLAKLYGVETKYFNKSVKRNQNRFPLDFMFQLSKEEYKDLRFQFGTSSEGLHGGRRYMPYAFTEHGIAMLSSILNSDEAIRINISIIRTFIHMRNILSSEENFVSRLRELEEGTSKLFRIVFTRLDAVERKTPLLPKDRKRIKLK